MKKRVLLVLLVIVLLPSCVNDENAIFTITYPETQGYVVLNNQRIESGTIVDYPASSEITLEAFALPDQRIHFYGWEFIDNGHLFYAINPLHDNPLIYSIDPDYDELVVNFMYEKNDIIGGITVNNEDRLIFRSLRNPACYYWMNNDGTNKTRLNLPDEQSIFGAAIDAQGKNLIFYDESNFNKYNFETEEIITLLELPEEINLSHDLREWFIDENMNYLMMGMWSEGFKIYDFNNHAFLENVENSEYESIFNIRFANSVFYFLSEFPKHIYKYDLNTNEIEILLKNELVSYFELTPDDNSIIWRNQYTANYYQYDLIDNVNIALNDISYEILYISDNNEFYFKDEDGIKVFNMNTQEITTLPFNTNELYFYNNIFYYTSCINENCRYKDIFKIISDYKSINLTEEW